MEAQKLGDRLRVRESTGIGLALVALVALGAALRIPGLCEWHLSWDDMWHLQDALQETPGELLARNLRAQVHGPLHYVGLHALSEVSRTPFALRWISLAPGLLLIPACYALGRELLGRGAGLFLAAGAAGAYQLVVLSQVLRPYAAMLLWVVLAITCLLAGDRLRDRRLRAGYGCFAVVAAFTQVAALIPLVAIAGVWAVRIARTERDRPRARALGWLGLQGLLLGPPVAYALTQLHFASRLGGTQGGDLERFVAHFWYFRSTFPTGVADAGWRLLDMLRWLMLPREESLRSWLLVLVSAVGLGLLLRDRRWTALGLAGGVAALGAVAGLLQLFPFAPTRHCAYAIPFLLLPGAYAFQWVYERLDGRLMAVVGIAVLALALDLDPDRYRRPREDFDTRLADWSATLEYVRSRAGPDDVVVLNRVGMQYLNQEAWLFGRHVRHPGHPDDHRRYPYDRWVMPGGEEHVLDGTRFWSCDGVHEWSSYLAAREPLASCLRELRARRPGGIGRVWFLVEKSDPFLAFATPAPLAALPTGSPARRLVASLRTDPFWQGFFTARERMRTPTTGAFAVPWSSLADSL